RTIKRSIESGSERNVRAAEIGSTNHGRKDVIALTTNTTPKRVWTGNVPSQASRMAKTFTPRTPANTRVERTCIAASTTQPDWFDADMIETCAGVATLAGDTGASSAGQT